MGYPTTCVAFASLLLAGCGTVANLTHTNPDGLKAPFGGVRQDVAGIEGALNGDDDDIRLEHVKEVTRAAICAADLPFSAVGDTLAYPYTRSYNFINSPTLVGPALQVAPPGSGIEPPPQTATQVPTSYESKADKAAEKAAATDDPAPKSAAPKADPAASSVPSLPMPSLTLPPRDAGNRSPSP